MRPGAFHVHILMIALLLGVLNAHGTAAATNFFSAGVLAYRSGQFAEAAAAFRSAVNQQPTSGALQNLGNAEWKQGHVGNAVLAWEQALWLNPFEANARNNLRFARDAAQLESPDLRWYEVASTWLPTHVWAWLTGLSVWTAVGALVLPGVLRRRKSAGQQIVAALALGIFLLCIPAHYGTLTRARIGFVLQSETALRLTPTAGAEAITRLAAGEPVRSLRIKGDYAFVRTSRSRGWMRRNEIGWVAERALVVPKSQGVRF